MDTSSKLNTIAIGLAAAIVSMLFVLLLMGIGNLLS